MKLHLGTVLLKMTGVGDRALRVNPALSLTAALALILRFNLTVGIPLYAEVAPML